MATATPNPISRLDVPASQLTADMAALVARQKQHAVDAAAQKRQLVEQQHLLDAYGDRVFPCLAAEHPECCSTDADYPGWSAWLADRIAQNQTTGGQS